MAKFSDVLRIVNGKNQRAVENPNGKYPIYGSGGIMGYADDYICKPDTVIIGRKGSINKPIYVDTPFWNVDTAFGLEADTDVLFPKYLYYFCVRFDFEKLNTTVTIPSLTKQNLLGIEIPLPPLAIQREIAYNLDKVSEAIEQCRKILEKLDYLVKAKFAEMFGDPITNPMGWERDICRNHIDLLSGYPFQSENYVNTGIRICGGLIIMPQYIDWNNCKYWASSDGYEEFLLNEDDIVMALDRPWISNGFKIAMISKEALPALLIQRTARIRALDINQKFLYYSFLCGSFDNHCNITGSLVPHISSKDIMSFNILLPPLPLQEQFAEYVQKTDRAKAAVKKTLEKAQVLKAALMQKYFG